MKTFTVVIDEDHNILDSYGDKNGILIVIRKNKNNDWDEHCNRTFAAANKDRIRSPHG